MGNLIMQIFRGMKGSYAFQLLGKAFLRLRTAVMNPFQRVVRRVQQIFNVNIITSRLVAPINAKVREDLKRGGKIPGRLLYRRAVLDLQDAGLLSDTGRMRGSLYLLQLDCSAGI